MASNPLTPLQQAEKSLRKVILDGAPYLTLPAHSPRRDVAQRQIDIAISSLVEEAQAAIYKLMP